MTDQKTEEFVERLIVKWLKRMDENPGVSGKPVALYRCFENNHELFTSHDNAGYFLLTESHLRFFVDYPYANPCGSEYAFYDTQIKDITSVCANYMKKNNIAAFVRAFFMAALCGGLLYFFPNMRSLFQVAIYILLAVSAIVAIGAFTFLKIKHYKIHIGSVNGGFTLMGCQNRRNKNAAAWNQPMTIVYNATICEKQLLAFIEQINARISVLQERGEYAFDTMEVQL